MKRLAYILAVSAALQGAASAQVVPRARFYQPPPPQLSPENAVKDARVQGYMRGSEVQRGRDAEEVAAAADQARIAADQAHRLGQAAAAAEHRARAAEQQAAQQAAVLGSKQVQGVIAALNSSQGNIDAAAQALADKMVQERAAKMASRAFWTRGPKIEGNIANLAVHLAGGGRVGGEWGPSARTDFGAALYLLPFNFRLFAEAGGSVQPGFVGPREAACGGDGASDRCLKPGRDGTLDWGVGAVFGRYAGGVSYSLGNILTAEAAYEGVVQSFSYTARGDSQTTRENVVQHAFRLGLGTTFFGVPMGAVLSAQPTEYVSPSGERYRTTQVFVSAKLAPWVW